MKWIFFLSIVFAACKHPAPKDDPAAWKKIKMDFHRFDQEGLSGPASGKVAVNYEFCIPASSKYWEQVKKIDSSVERNGGKGRVGCTAGEWLVIGSTHQKNFQRVLFELASLPYIREIQETFYE